METAWKTNTDLLQARYLHLSSLYWILAVLGEWLDLTLRVFFNLNYSMILFLNSFSHITQTPPAFFCGFRVQIFLSGARKCCHQLVKSHYRHTCARSKIPWIYRYTAPLDCKPLFKLNTSQSQ